MEGDNQDCSPQGNFAQKTVVLFGRITEGFWVTDMHEYPYLPITKILERSLFLDDRGILSYLHGVPVSITDDSLGYLHLLGTFSQGPTALDGCCPSVADSTRHKPGRLGIPNSCNFTNSKDLCSVSFQR